MNDGNTQFVQIVKLPTELLGKILYCRSMVVIRALTKANFILFILGIVLAVFASIPS